MLCEGFDVDMSNKFVLPVSIALDKTNSPITPPATSGKRPFTSTQYWFMLNGNNHDIENGERDLDSFIHIEKHSNGGASVVHLFQDEIEHLNADEMHELCEKFFTEVFSEGDNEKARNVMGIVHDAARYLPEMVSYLAVHHPDTLIKMGQLGKSGIESMTMEEYHSRVTSTYCNGTFRCGGMNQFSLVGTVQEEVGGYFPGILDMLEQSPFLAATLPWGSLSALHLKDRQQSDDGPILWVRPGEQVIPSAELGLIPAKKKKRFVIGITLIVKSL